MSSSIAIGYSTTYLIGRTRHMQQPASHPKTVFRACIAAALRTSPALMTQLVQAVDQVLAARQTDEHYLLERALLADGLRLLRRHEQPLVQGFAAALLESMAGDARAASAAAPAKAALESGEFTLIDDGEMQAQVELAKVQQATLHATEAVLCELDTYVSAALGLQRVQPERNPLRPENYIRALQQTVGATGVAPEVRQLWMQHMRELLGKLLAQEYADAIVSLRTQGVQPVGYVVLPAPAGKPQPAPDPAAGRDSDATPAQADDELLDMNSLRELLAGSAPAAAAPAQPPAQAPTALADGPGSALTGAIAPLCTQPVRDAAPTAQALPAAQQAARASRVVDPGQRQLLANEIAAQIRKLPGVAQVPVDMLDFAVGPWAQVIAHARLKRSASGAERQDDPNGYQALVPLLLWSTQPRLTRKAPERLNEAIPGLLARLRRGLKSIQYPAPQTSAFLQRLVALHQAAFENRAHTPVPASVHELASGFAPVSIPMSIPAPLPAPLSTPAPASEFAETLRAPAVVTEPAPAPIASPMSVPEPQTGPGAQAPASAQTPGPVQAFAPGGRSAPAAQPTPAPGLPPAPGPEAQPAAAALPQSGAEAVSAAPSGPTPHAPVAADPAPQADAPASSAHADFVVGAWVELSTHGRAVRTQLTWVNPQGTLFLFTAPDASTQSMTRRMRDKFAAEGLLRVLPPAPPDPDPAPDPAKAPQSRPLPSFFPSSLFPSSRLGKSR